MFVELRAIWGENAGKSVKMIRDIDALVDGWVEPKSPTGEVLEGKSARLEAFDPAKHGPDIFAANAVDDRIWDYLPYGPFENSDEYVAWADTVAGQADPFFYAIQNKETGRWEGIASYLRITPAMGSIEVGHINFSPALQRTRAASEAMFLMMQWAFDAGYRRYEWKCNASNMGSRRAAQRLGLSYEGIFRQAAVIKGRNRDTAWFAAIDGEWPVLRDAFQAWLSSDNFDADGMQTSRLTDLTASVLVTLDPAI